MVSLGVWLVEIRISGFFVFIKCVGRKSNLNLKCFFTYPENMETNHQCFRRRARGGESESESESEILILSLVRDD